MAKQTQTPDQKLPSKPSMESSVDLVVNGIRKAIQHGELVPGQRLAEVDLSERFAVSRTVIREALRNLAADGTIDLERFRGARIHRYTEEEFAEIHAIREVLEGLSARLATAAISTPENLATFNKVVEILRDAYESKDLPKYIEANISFHSVIRQLSGNSRLNTLSEQLQLPITRLGYTQLIAPQATDTSMKDHEDIIEAILSGDAEAAEVTMRRHIRRSGRSILQSGPSFFGSPASNSK